MEHSNAGDPTSTMIFVKRSEIPSYLKDSEFYRSLQDEADETISIPKDCMKLNDAVYTNENLRSLLLTLRFWVASYIRESILVYTLSQPLKSYKHVLSEFYDDMPALKHIKRLVASPEPLVVAIKSKELEFVKYFHKRGHSWPEDACCAIIKTGNVAMLEYAFQAGCKVSDRACTVAAGAGHLECLRFLHVNGMSWDKKTTASAARNGHLACLQYAHENGFPWFCGEKYGESETFFDLADDRSSAEEDERCVDDSDDDEDGDDGWEGKFKRDICIIAAVHARLDCLKYAHSQGVPLLPRVIKVASKHPKGLECVKYAHQQGLRLTQQLCLNAVSNKNVEMLKYLRENGCPCDNRVFKSALLLKAYACIKYLHENGFPWHKGMCKMVAQLRDIDTVLFLLYNGCPPDDSIWQLEDYFDSVLKCFVLLDLSWSETPLASMMVALKSDLEDMQSMIDADCPWHPETTLSCAKMEDVAMLKLVHENGCPWHNDTCKLAALVGSIECLRYAHTHGAPMPKDLYTTLTELEGSSGKIDEECLEYVKQNINCS